MMACCLKKICHRYMKVMKIFAGGPDYYMMESSAAVKALVSYFFLRILIRYRWNYAQFCSVNS
jgi:hypothetical protein